MGSTNKPRCDILHAFPVLFNVENIARYSEIPVISNILQGNAYLYTYDSIALINPVSATI